MSFPTNVSDTDLAIFQNLSNPEKVDFTHSRQSQFHKPKSPQQPAYLTEKKENIRIQIGAEEDIAHQRNYSIPEATFHGGTSRFANAVQEQLRKNPLPKIPTPPPRPSARLFTPLKPNTPSRAAPHISLPSQRNYQPPLQMPAVDENYLRSMHANAPVQMVFPQNDDDQRRIKQRLLNEISSLQRDYVFARLPTFDDSIEDIQNEIDQARNSIEMKHAVKFIRDGIPLVYQMLEGANNRFGPFLPIQGFTDELLEKMDKDPQRYNYVLERLYRRYWKKGSVSPIAEFMLVFIVPFVVYAGKRKFFGPKQTNNHERPVSADPEPSRQYYAPEPLPTSLPPQQHSFRGNNVGESVRPQPPQHGNYFPPAMMQQPEEIKQPPPIRANIPQTYPSSTRKKLKPPSHTQPHFSPVQQPLEPVNEEEQEQKEEHVKLPDDPFVVDVPPTPIKKTGIEISPSVHLPPLREDQEEDEEDHD